MIHFLFLFRCAVVVELGDDIAPCLARDTRTLVIANHQSTADVPLLMACFSAKPDILPNIMWIMDRVFKFTNFGIVSVLHQDFFIRAVGVLFYRYVWVYGHIHPNVKYISVSVCDRLYNNSSIFMGHFEAIMPIANDMTYPPDLYL